MKATSIYLLIMLTCICRLNIMVHFFPFIFIANVCSRFQGLNDSEDNWKYSKVFIYSAQSKLKLVVILQN